MSISKDKMRLDKSLICAFLQSSYWCSGRTELQVLQSIENSICYGAYSNEAQVGFARVITDKVTFAYIADVFIVSSHRSQGYASALIRNILQDEELEGLTNWYLITKDAQSFYEKFGFKDYHHSNRSVMQLLKSEEI